VVCYHLTHFRLIKLREAIREGDIEAVKRHLAAGMDVNARDDNGWNSLHLAAENGHKEIAELLIEKGANVNAKDKYSRKTSRDWAIERGYTETADLLRKHGGKTTDELNAAKSIDDAAKYGLIEAVKKHLANGANVNTVVDGISGRTLLFLAAQWGHKEIVELLIAKGADVNAKSVVGEAPLDRAIRFNRAEITDLLRKHGGKTGEELKAEAK